MPTRIRPCVTLYLTIPVRKLVKYLGSRALDKSYPTVGLLLSNRRPKMFSNNLTIVSLFYLHSVWRNTSFLDRWCNTLHSLWLTWPRHAFPVAPPIQLQTSTLRVRLSLNSQFLQCPSIQRSPSSLYPSVTRPISTGCDLFVCQSQSKISRVARKSES